MFIIEPCQTMWAYNEKQTMVCAMRVPKGSTLLAFEANHLLIKRPITVSDADENYETLCLTAIEMARCAEDDELGKDAVFIGIVRIGEELKSHAVFANNQRMTMVFNILQTFNGGDPDRIAKIFAEDILRRSTQKLGG